MLAYAAPAEEAEELAPPETPPAEEEEAIPNRIPIAPARPVRMEEPSSPKRKRKVPQRDRAPRSAPRTRSPARAPASAVSPPLSYLEVMTRAMAMARVAERDAKSARYDAFFQRRYENAR